jgi:hypothetical protein
MVHGLTQIPQHSDVHRVPNVSKPWEFTILSRNRLRMIRRCIIAHHQLHHIGIRRDEFRQLPKTHIQPCRPVALADTTGWQRDDGLSLPVGFAPDSSFRSYHGGLKWRADELALIVENGWWGVTYDSVGHLTSCRVQARSGVYIVNEVRTATGYQFRAFPLDPEWRPSTAVVGQAPTEEGLRILWTSLMIMTPPRCRYMTGGPVRDPRAPPC